MTAGSDWKSEVSSVTRAETHLRRLADAEMEGLYSGRKKLPLAVSLPFCSAQTLLTCSRLAARKLPTQCQPSLDRATDAFLPQLSSRLSFSVMNI